ncbi:hypothetical protein [Terrabacter lapilli]
MNDHKPAGWYYVGDGKLRYSDDYGWTDFYMETTDPRTRDWPPPPPQTLLGQLREDKAALVTASGAQRHRRRGALFHRYRQAK